MRKITIEIDDDQAARVAALNGGAWSDSPEFWAQVVDWGLDALRAIGEVEESAKVQGPPVVVPPSPDGADPF